MSIDEYWNHFIHKHFEVDDEIRLNEIRESVFVWRIYWEYYNNDDKENNKTQIKLNQIEQKDFKWQNVVD